jgi:hypothetical protein
MKTSTSITTLAFAFVANVIPSHAATYQQYFGDCMAAQHAIMDRALNMKETREFALEALALDPNHSEDRLACKDAAARGINGTGW